MLAFSLAFFLLVPAAGHAADDPKPMRAKFFGEDQAGKDKPEAKPMPAAPEREDYSANYGRDPRVTPRESQTRPTAALASGKRDATPPSVQTQSPRPVAATALAGAGESPSEPAPARALKGSPGSPGSSSKGTFAPGERPRDSVHSAPARTSPPPAQLFDAEPQRPPLEEPTARPRPWENGPAAKPQEPHAAPPGGAEPRRAGAPGGYGGSRPGGPALVSMSAPAQPSAPSPVFVSMELDLSNDPGNYRDAVKSLSQAAGFSLDPRFAPVYRDSRRDRVSIWGWVPAAQVREAVSAPGVVRLEAAPQAQAVPAAENPEAQWRLLLRLPPAEEGSPDPAADFAGTLMRLSEQGFAWKRSEPRDSAGLVAIVGTMPPRSLKRVMADPAVVRIEPFHPAPNQKPGSLQASAGPSLAWLRSVATSPVFLLLVALVPLIARFLREP